MILLSVICIPTRPMIPEEHYAIDMKEALDMPLYYLDPLF